MKPVPFDYIRVETVREACAALSADPEAMVLAGGQTLIPMLNMRLARPTRVVDIAWAEGLTGITGPDTVPGRTRDHDGLDADPQSPGSETAAESRVCIGAMTRQAAAEASPVVRSRLPLLAKALPWVGHAPTRARGTVGGSVANADPAAEIPLVLTALGGAVHWRGPEGPGTARAADFFVGPMETSLPEGSVLTAADFPVWPDRTGAGFGEVATRASDYALVSAAAQVTLDADGTCIRAVAAVGGAVDRPTAVDLTALLGSSLADRAIADAASAGVASLAIAPPPHTTEAYCRRAAARLLARAVTEARDSA